MYFISENGDFPPQYFVLKQDEDGILRPVFGPDPDFVDAKENLQSYLVRIKELEMIKVIT